MNTATLQPKERSLITRAEEYLTEYILGGEVAPGDYLPPEQALSQKLGIGRNTLREAISILQSKGLVERQHGLGLRVIDRSQEAASEMLALLMQRHGAAADDLLEVRRYYEVPAAACAAARATPEDVAAIREALEAMHAPGVTMEQGVDADLAFHLAVARATHNVVLLAIVETIRSLLRDAILFSMKAGFDAEGLHNRHVAIMEAIERRDAERARQAMVVHLGFTERSLRIAGAIARDPEQR
jgi:GntR family transcriptional regulator, transcriptional repressor for pyruvate dehydrogenase complex